MVKLNPYALTLRRTEVLAERRRAELKLKRLAAAREKKAIPETKEHQYETALARAHEPQQRENYKRLVKGEGYTLPVDKEGKVIEKIALEVTPRPAKKGILPKGPKKERKKKAKAKTEEKKEEKKGPIDWANRPMPKMPVMKREPRVKKVKKEGGADGGKKGAKGKKGDAAKGEAGKEAGKEAAKGKGEAAKGGAKKEEPKAGKKEAGGKDKKKG
jgi:hypothetical protein